MFNLQPFEPIALAALLADAVTTYLGLRAGLRERHPILRLFASVGGSRLPWAPGVVMLALAAYQHYFNWSRFVSERNMLVGWAIVAAAHAVVALLNVRSISRSAA